MAASTSGVAHPQISHSAKGRKLHHNIMKPAQHSFHLGTWATRKPPAWSACRLHTLPNFMSFHSSVTLRS